MTVVAAPLSSPTTPISAPTPTPRRVTPKQLSRMPDRNRWELVDGRLEERPASSESARIGASIVRLLGDEAERTGGAVVYGADVGYQCFPPPADPDLIRKPDASVIAIDRRSALVGDPGYLPIPADLAVEVVSRNDLHRTVAVKREQYLAAGFRCLWVVDPETRTVSIFRPDGSAARLRGTDEITAESVLPEFRCRVDAFFARPGATVPPGT